MEVRIFTPTDGPALGALVGASVPAFLTMEVDWEKAQPWIVAEDEQGLAGAIQVLPSRPFGHLEMLVLREGLRKREQAMAVTALTKAGASFLRQMGCDSLSGSCRRHPKRAERFVQVTRVREGEACIQHPSTSIDVLPF